jgi:putative inorganic carbon (hco3(-)) transporter
MTHGALAQTAALLGAAGSALVILPQPRRAPLVSGFALLAVTEALLAVALLPGHDLRRFASPAGAVALVGGVVVAVAGGWLFVRLPAIVPVVILAAAPFRLPVDLGSQHAFLLLPLYLVLAAASLALVYRALTGERLTAIPRIISVPAVALIAWAAFSLTWALDLEQGSIELLFFLFPFAALVAVVARSPYAAWLPRALAVTLVALAAVFAGIGLYQAWSRTLIFAQDLRVANAYTTYFRVTSLFKDPSIYGRQLVLALSVVVVLLWLGRVRIWYAVGVVALLFAGLYFSYSQSSMVVLFATVLAATILLADRRSRRTVAAIAIAVALAGASLAVASARDTGLRRATSGRTRLVSVTTTVIRNHPVVGVGIGSQPLASRRELDTKRRAEKNASHTTALTVFAELGMIGFVLYLAFIAGAAKLLLEAMRRDRATGLCLATAFLVLLLHSLFYSGFFEDPLTWGSLGLAALLAALDRPAAANEPDPSLKSSWFRRLEGRWNA